jgi:hypothetical protein
MNFGRDYVSGSVPFSIRSYSSTKFAIVFIGARLNL